MKYSGHRSKSSLVCSEQPMRKRGVLFVSALMDNVTAPAAETSHVKGILVAKGPKDRDVLESFAALWLSHVRLKAEGKQA